MRMPKFLAWTVSGLTLAGAGAVITNTATPASAEATAAALQLVPSGQVGVAVGMAGGPGPSGDVAKERSRNHHAVSMRLISRNINRNPRSTRGSVGNVGSTEPTGPMGPRGYPGNPAAYSPLKWGIIGRNTIGGPNAVFRVGPWGRNPLTNYSANMPPPYGIGSLGIIVGNATEKIAFGNETDFAGVPLSALNTLKYWVFTGADSMTGISLPLISIEVNPHLGPITYTSVNYMPENSVSPSAPATRIPNIWQQYDATATGNKWYATGAAGAATGCTQATPCSFTALKAAMPNAEISYSLGFSKGRDTPFIGALDGLQVNNTVYDFEPLGVFRRNP